MISRRSAFGESCDKGEINLGLPYSSDGTYMMSDEVLHNMPIWDRVSDDGNERFMFFCGGVWQLTSSYWRQDFLDGKITHCGSFAHSENGPEDPMSATWIAQDQGTGVCIADSECVSTEGRKELMTTYNADKSVERAGCFHFSDESYRAELKAEKGIEGTCDDMFAIQLRDIDHKGRKAEDIFYCYTDASKGGACKGEYMDKPACERCDNWCEDNARSWSDKCDWISCSDCDVCKEEHPECKGWCSLHEDPWASKCLFEECKGCLDCEGVEPCGSFCAEHTDPRSMCTFDGCQGCDVDCSEVPLCGKWCVEHEKPWAQKCVWEDCAGCDECATDPKCTDTGRCGASQGDKKCSGTPSWAIYCNEDNGWCGDTEAHRTMQPSDAYDMVKCSPSTACDLPADFAEAQAPAGDYVDPADPCKTGLCVANGEFQRQEITCPEDMGEQCDGEWVNTDENTCCRECVAGDFTCARTDGRCGPDFGDAKCNKGHGGPSFAKYCNEDNGWCGSSWAHSRATPGSTYDYWRC